jgi:hypothetical protein
MKIYINLNLRSLNHFIARRAFFSLRSWRKRSSSASFSTNSCVPSISLIVISFVFKLIFLTFFRRLEPLLFAILAFASANYYFRYATSAQASAKL